MARVSTFWIEHATLQENFIFDDRFLWFGTMINRSLINPNHVRAFNIAVHDNPFDVTVFSNDAYKSFTPSIPMIQLSDLRYKYQRKGRSGTTRHFD